MVLENYLHSLEDEALRDITIPTEYQYLKLVRILLLSVSSWPQKEIGEYEPYYQAVILKVIYTATTIGCEAGGIIYLYVNTSKLDFLEIGHAYIVTLLSAVSLSRVLLVTLSPKYRHVVKDFLTKSHLFYYKDRSEFAMKTHKMVHTVSHFFTLYLVVLMLTGLSLFNLIPMYNNYTAGRYSTGGKLQDSKFEHSLYYSYPFDVSTEIKGYTVAAILHWYFSYLCATWFCMIDLLLSLMVFHIWGHFKILIDMMDNFPLPSSKSNSTLENAIQAEMYSEEELVQVSERLKECITYHREILHFTDSMSDAFGPMLFIYLLFHQATGCLLLLECSQLTAAALFRYLPLTIILFQQLIQLSVIFELIGSESEKLKDAVYCLPWECMDGANRKSVHIFLMNVQEPVHVKAMGLVDVGLTSMAAILKTTLSYFTFLRSK